MNPVVVIGSGPSGVHFALSMLRKGYRVVMLDVGHQKSAPVNPEHSLLELKTYLDDPTEYFLGKDFSSVLYPGAKEEYYGFPPGKQYIFTHPSQFSLKADGFSPLTSFARGGLAEAWTGGVYPFNEGEVKDFPFPYEDMHSAYSEVADRIGISGRHDDLARTMPLHDHVQEPLHLDPHSQNLLQKYERRKEWLNRRFGCYLGRARVATLTEGRRGRSACTYRARCLWGCPNGAFYTPSITLDECQTYGNFSYVRDRYVSHFRTGKDKRITHVVGKIASTNIEFEQEVGTLVLAAGTLSSSRIVLESLRRKNGTVPRLSGLMDNPQIMIPFVNVAMVGKAVPSESYQYHQLAFGIDSGDARHSIHALVTTLKTALFHPLIQQTPTDLKTATYLFRHIHSALGLVNVNLHDSAREDSYITLEEDSHREDAHVLVRYSVDDTYATRVKAAIKVVKQVLRRLGCVVPPGTVRIRPPGASVHYVGTIPMSRGPRPLTVSPNCQSHDFPNLYIVDGTTFPFLPAKNVTFSLMANAVRVAEKAF